MSHAIAMIELSSISKGMAVCDAMAKAAHITILSATTGCPGRYVILVGGDTSNVKSAFQVATESGGKKISDSFFLSNVHPDVLTYYGKKNRTAPYGALGIVEYSSLPSILRAADAALKAGNVTLLELRHGFGIAGRGVLTVVGDVGAVRSAVKQATLTESKLIGSEVIARPHKDFFEKLI